MSDRLKEYIQVNRSEFDLLEAPDQWAVVLAAAKKTGFLAKPKNLDIMIKYGFGASALVIGTMLTVYQLHKKPVHENRSPMAAKVQKIPAPPPSPAEPTLPPMPLPRLLQPIPLVLAPPPPAPVAPAPVEVPPAVPAEPQPAPLPPVLQAEQALTPVADSFSAATIDTTMKGIKRLEVEGIACDIRVSGHASEDLRFHGEMKGGEILMSGIKTRRKNYVIRYEIKGDLLRVWMDEEEQDRHTRNKNGSEKSSLEFEVPASIALRILNSSGNISADNLKPEKAVLKTSFGNISASDIQGNCELNSASGNIKAENITGTLKGESGFGGQRYENVQGNIYLVSASGNISVDHLTGNAEVTTSFGHQKYSDVTGDVSANAASGNISIKQLKGHTTAKTSFGTQTFEEIEGDINSSAESGGITVKGSKGKLSLSTSFGSISGKDVLLKGSSDFKASSGNISVDLLNEMKELRFDLKTSSGNLSVEKGSSKSNSDRNLTTGEGPIVITGVSSFGNQHYR